MAKKKNKKGNKLMLWGLAAVAVYLLTRPKTPVLAPDPGNGNGGVLPGGSLTATGAGANMGSVMYQNVFSRMSV